MTVQLGVLLGAPATLGRRWRHSRRHDKALDRARRLYERLDEDLSIGDALVICDRLQDVADAWGFVHDGNVLVEGPRVVILRAWRSAPAAAPRARPAFRA
jgi:hypothetical protein